MIDPVWCVVWCFFAAFGATACGATGDSNQPTDASREAGTSLSDGGNPADSATDASDSDARLVQPDASLDGALATDATVDAASSPPDAGHQDAGIPLLEADFLSVLPELLCDRAVRCEGKHGQAARRWAIYCHPDALALQGGVALSFPGTRFDAQSAQTCIDGLRRAECPPKAPLPSECDSVFRPTLGDTESCVSDEECIGGGCVALSDACGSVCRALTPSGGACSTNTQCAAPLVCVDESCRSQGAIGQDCDDSADCDGLSYCNERSCTILPTAGQACSTALGADPCPDNTVCTRDGSGGDKTCQSGAGVEDGCSADEPCSEGLLCSESECISLSNPSGNCASQANCPTLFVCTREACRPLPVSHGVCSVLTPCLTGACVDGMCTLLSNGTSCMGPLECSSRLCSAGACQPRAVAGEFCVVDGQCDSGLECVEVGDTRQCTNCT